MYLFSRTKTEGEKVKDNEYGDVVRKIKERQESLMRTLENVVNVPMSAKTIEMDTVKINNYVEKPIIEEEQHNETFTNKFDSEQEFDYDRDAYKNLFNNLNIDEDTKIRTELPKETMNYSEQSNIVQFPEVGEFDVNSTYSEIKGAQNTIVSMRERAQMARRDADESDRILESVIARNEESQRRLREAELRSQALEKELLNLLSIQKASLDKEIKRTESIINDSNRRYEMNNSKIGEYESQIKAIDEKTSELTAKNLSKEELLNSFQQILKNEYDYTDSNDEETYRRVA